MDNIQIYVDNVNGSDDTERRGGSSDPVRTADRAFSLLPPFWRGSAEIIFAVTPEPIYDIVTDKVSQRTRSDARVIARCIQGRVYRDRSRC